MWILIIAILTLGLAAFLLSYFKVAHRTTQHLAVVETDGCCGQHETCEKDSLLAAMSQSIEYFEDEELDQYRGIAAAAYAPQEVEQFYDVFSTLRDHEVAPWLRSLQLRQLELPEELREEVFMVVREVREDHAARSVGE